MITTVIFDLDDTLYDEIDYCKSGFASVCERIASLPGAPTAERIFEALWKQFSAGNHTKTFNAALEDLGINCDDPLIAELVRVYRNHVPNIALPSDSRDVLARLSRKYTLALLTDGFLPAQRLKVQALGIEKYFKTILYTEDLGRDSWKPSPAGLERIMQMLDAPSHSMAYVADNELKDFIAPNKLGMATICILRPSRIHTQTSTDPIAKPQHTITQIADLPPLLDKL
jgi:putative hydrolase of the HAD superfamily